MLPVQTASDPWSKWPTYLGFLYDEVQAIEVGEVTDRLVRVVENRGYSLQGDDIIQ